jgi:hypothetical protein
VQAQRDLWAPIRVYKRVVDTTERCTRVKRDMLDTALDQQIDDQV